MLAKESPRPLCYCRTPAGILGLSALRAASVNKRPPNAAIESAIRLGNNEAVTEK